MEKAVGEGADVALVNGIDAKRSLAAIEEKPRKKSQRACETIFILPEEAIFKF